MKETHLLGKDTWQFGVRADETDRRIWIRELPVCSILQNHQMVHVGVCEAVTPYRIVRTALGGSYFLACVSGEGRVLIDGRWQHCGQGKACLLPPRTLNAFEPIEGSRWRFCWVRYRQPAHQMPVAAVASPVLADFDPEPLQAAITGLYFEASGVAVPALMRHWVELVQSYVLRFSEPLSPDDRLWRLWGSVTASLDRKWTLPSLAAEAHLSSEHLRRLCQKQLGRSPMQQVAFFRMQKAGELLATSDEKIETIAAQVGYRSAFVFSNAFKKWVGWRPSQYRVQRRESKGS